MQRRARESLVGRPSAWRLALTVSCLATPFVAWAMECSPAGVRAFFDETKIDTSTVTYKSLYNEYCHENKSKNGIGVSMGKAGSFGGNSESMNKACATHDEKYFEDYRLSIRASGATEEVKLALANNCFGGQTIYAKETRSLIELNVYARSTNGDEVRFKRVTWHPISAARIDGTAPQEGAKMRPQGFPITLVRLDPEADIRVVVWTSLGATEKTTLFGAESIPIEWRAEQWSPNNDPAYYATQFTCISKIGTVTTKVGGLIDAMAMGVNGYYGESYRDGYCAKQYGQRLVLWPGQSEPQAIVDTWTAPLVAGTPSKWTCMKNNTAIQDLECPRTPSDKLCSTEEGRIAVCAAKFGPRQNETPCSKPRAEQRVKVSR